MSNANVPEELVRCLFGVGTQSLGIEFGEWKGDPEAVMSYWDVNLVLVGKDPSPIEVHVGTCWLQGVSLADVNNPDIVVDFKDKQVDFYVDMDSLTEIISKEVSKRIQEVVRVRFNGEINPELNVQIYGIDYT